MLYAAVCTGSYASYLDAHLIDRLGYRDRIFKSIDGARKIKFPVYLPEAVPVSASSRSSSPAPQLPTLSVEFTVAERGHEENDIKAIQIFLGSDMLRKHNADILFSSNQLTLYDDERSKVQIPLVRPEDERTFKSLYITSGYRCPVKHTLPEKEARVSFEANTMGEGSVASSTLELPSAGAPKENEDTPTTSSEEGSTGRRSLEQRPTLGLTTNRVDSKDSTTESPASAAPRSGTSPAIWSNWRRDTEKPSSMDLSNEGKNTSSSSTYQRKDTGIKILKPMKSGSRTLSSGVSQSTSPATAGQSRFFDEGKRRTSHVGGSEAGDAQPRRSVSGEKAKENPPTLTKTRSANPVGGASAFAWLNSGKSK
jgi:ubiquitin carboxyl-terminal hydrolase 4/11/15